MKAPRTKNKIQISSKRQTPKGIAGVVFVHKTGSTIIVVWDFELFWSLALGAWCLFLVLGASFCRRLEYPPFVPQSEEEPNRPSFGRFSAL